MAFFQTSVVNKYLNSQDKDIVKQAYEKFTAYFHNHEIQKNIRNAKEEQFQEGFLRELFVNVLGYTLNPNPEFNLTTEFKNEHGAKKADGAILYDAKAIAVIELKGTDTTDLDKVTTQAFGYKNNQSSCIYIITSNFEKLRFYINNQIEYIEFNLFTLTEEQFKLLWFCLNKDSLLAGTPEKAKKESLVADENVTKQLYKDYSAFKNDLWLNMIKNSPEADQLLLYKKTQKLLDRFLFIFFSEDSGLLPPNSISSMVARWGILQEQDAYKPLYDIFKQFFSYINTGKKGKTNQDDIFAYNGGLFLPDDILENISIDDEVIHPHVMKLTAYNFESDVNVNILGHIFENSLNEIENVRARLEGRDVDKKQTKRKKDGVFYTPKYITKYIVDNTVGKLCAEKKVELGVDESEYAKGSAGRQKKTRQKLYDNLSNYRSWLLTLTICDPACGSGAFLNQALEFLIAEHAYTDELEIKLLGEGIPFRYVTDKILENNLFGVDINEESVEIAKLSLWLRTAEKGRKLTSLNNNIKCGNSLIDDPEVAGDLAFNWEKEFPDVFAKGGFDVVIGNPPYVVLSSFKNKEFYYLQNRYQTSFGRLNTFALFTEKVTKLIYDKSKVGIIIPDSICQIDYYTNLRKYILDLYPIDEIIELGDGIFSDATVPAIIFLFSKTRNNYIKIGNKESIFNNEIRLIYQNLFFKTPKYSFNLYVDEIFIKLNDSIDNDKIYALKDLITVKIGVCTGNNNKHISSDKIFKNSKKVLQGKSINRYLLNDKGLFINYNKKELLRARDENIFLKTEKLLMRQTSDKLILTYDNNQYYTIDSLFVLFEKDNNLGLKYILALLNSKLLNRHYQKLNPEKGRIFAQVKIDYVNELPLYKAPISEQQPFIDKVDIILKLNENLQAVSSKFIGLLQSELSIEKLTRKIENWHTLEWADFVKELKKLKITLTGEQKEDWFERFNRLKVEVQTLKTKNEEADNEIDEMVYKLYELTEEEIKIVESE